MTEQMLRLRQRRSFGETLNLTFVFVRRYWRVLLQSLVQLVLPLLVVIVGLVVLLLQTYVVGVESAGHDSTTMIIVTIASVFVCIALLAIAFAIASAVYYAIVRLALKHGDNVTVAQVRTVVRSSVMSLVGMYIFQGILSTVLSYIIGIPMMFVMGVGKFEVLLEMQAVLALLSLSAQLAFITYASCSYAVLVIEGSSIFNSIQRSIKLVRGSFWPTAGMVIVVSMIVYLMMLAPIAHPVLIGSILYALFDPVSLSQWILNTSLATELLGAIYGLFVALSFFFVWMFPTTAIALHYLSLVEARDGVGLAIRVHTLIPPAPVEEPIEVSAHEDVLRNAKAEDTIGDDRPSDEQGAEPSTVGTSDDHANHEEQSVQSTIDPSPQGESEHNATQQ